MRVAGLPSALAAAIDDLVETKARTNELSNGTRLRELDVLIADELARADSIAGVPRPADAVDRANALFRRLVNS